MKSRDHYEKGIGQPLDPPAPGNGWAIRSWILLFSAVSVIAGGACGGLDSLRSPDEVERLSESVDTFHLTDPFGRPVSVVTDRPERPTLLVFNAADCGHCRQEAASVAAFALQYRGRIDVYSVQLDATAAAAQRFIRRLPGVKAIWDPGRQFASAMNVVRAPQIVFIGTDGTTLLRESWLSLKLREEAQALFDKPTAAITQQSPPKG